MSKSIPDDSNVVSEDYYFGAPDDTVVISHVASDTEVPFWGVVAFDDETISNFFEVDEIGRFVTVDSTVSWFGEYSWEFDADNIDAESHELFASGGTRDGQADDLHAEATKLYDKANTAYQKIPNHKYPHIRINSGVRDSSKQAQLYIAYIRHRYGGPAAPRANKPGTSNHEYGLAIDVFRKLDEVNLRKALTGAGWTNNVADEGWHFDAASIASWQKLQTKIGSIRKKYSDPFGNSVASFFEFTTRIEKNYPIWKAERDRLEVLQKKLVAEQSYLKGESDRLQAVQSNLRRRTNNFNRDVGQLNRLRDRINSFNYTYCPNGNSFDNCSHNAQKRRYVNERNAMVRDYNNRAADLQQRKRRLDGDIADFNRQAREFEERARRFENNVKQFQADVEANNKLATRLKGWIDKAEQIKKELPGKVAQIQSAVDKVRNG